MEFNKRTAYVYIKTLPGHTKQVHDLFRKNDWVIGAWTVTGEYDIVAWINAKNEDDVYTYANTIKTWDGVDHTTSNFVHNGYLQDFRKLDNQNGVLVRLRTDRMEDALKRFKDYDFIGSWANVPGEYDFTLHILGDNIRVALENVLRLTENRNWRTLTYVPVHSYLNANYAKHF